MVLLSSRSIQAFFDQNGQMLVAISQNMDTLREQNKQTSEILTTFRTASTGSPDEALAKLLDNAASHIANPYMRSVFKKALEITIRRAQESFEQGQILRRDAEARDISFSPRLKLANRQWRLLTTNSSRTAKSLFGDIAIQTNTYKTTIERENGHEHMNHVAQNEIRIIFRPAAWLVRFGLAYELQLGLLRVSPKLENNFPSLSTGTGWLLSRKQASVWDTNSNGWTPLHVCF